MTTPEMITVLRLLHEEHSTYGDFTDCRDENCREIGDKLEVLLALESVCKRLRKLVRK